MFRSNDQRALLWQRLFPPNKEQQNSSLQQQQQQPSAMMSLSDNWQQEQRLQQLQQLRIHQQLLSSAHSYHFQGDAIGQRMQPSIPGLTSAHLDMQQYQALQGMIAEEDHLLKLRQLRQLHDLQKYQDLAAQERVSGMTRSADFVTAASPSIFRQSFNPASMPEIADNSATIPKSATTINTTTNTRTPFTTPTATTTTSITDASMPPPAADEEDEDEDETSASPHKRKSKKKDTKWLITLGELKYYREAHGDCIVPRGYALNPRLASWVAEQRKQYKLLQDGKQSSITPERISLLSEIDFAWNAQEAAWARHMTDLKKFRKEAGHCHVPLSHDKYPRLGLWVKEQRRHYTLLKQGKQSHMTIKRAHKLDKVGFCWDTHEATWLERLRELTDYKEEYGNCAVPTNYAGNPKLGTWVHHQRRQRRRFKDSKRCHITLERIKALDQLGFVWYPRRDPHSNRDGNSSSDDSDSVADPSSQDFRPCKRHKTH